MKRFSLTGLILSIVITGCVSLPDPVPEEFLVNKTPEESKKLADIESAIIKKKNEIDRARKEYDQSEEKANIAEERISVLEKEKSLFAEKEKLYTIEKDEKNLGDIRNKIVENETQLVKARAISEYSSAYRDYCRALFEYNETELAVSVAELYYEKSLIARDFLLKKDDRARQQNTDTVKTATFANQDSDKAVDVQMYSNYFVKQKDALRGKGDKLKEMTAKLRSAENKLKAIGCEVPK
ncbi:MAG: hypothetical protein MUD12_14565 [Spirochaetes bacterium]|nr:hypothetical protein [Spirochaetota bacterium]